MVQFMSPHRIATEYRARPPFDFGQNAAHLSFGLLMAPVVGGPRDDVELGGEENRSNEDCARSSSDLYGQASAGCRQSEDPRDLPLFVDSYGHCVEAVGGVGSADDQVVAERSKTDDRAGGHVSVRTPDS